MSEGDNQLKGLEHAYQVLDVPQYTSAHSIKQSYRRLVKRWHPDLYTADTPAHAEATQMTKLINEAYSAIAHAPLRYHVEAYPQQATRRRAQSAGPTIRTDTEKLQKTDRLEFWVRFACGALAGMFVCLDLVISALPESPPSLSILALGALVVILGFGLGAARYGDKFWYSIFRRWWLWS